MSSTSATRRRFRRAPTPRDRMHRTCMSSPISSRAISNAWSPIPNSRPHRLLHPRPARRRPPTYSAMAGRRCRRSGRQRPNVANLDRGSTGTARNTCFRGSHRALQWISDGQRGPSIPQVLHDVVRHTCSYLRRLVSIFRSQIPRYWLLSSATSRPWQNGRCSRVLAGQNGAWIRGEISSFATRIGTSPRSIPALTELTTDGLVEVLAATSAGEQSSYRLPVDEPTSVVLKRLIDAATHSQELRAIIAAQLQHLRQRPQELQTSTAAA